MDTGAFFQKQWDWAIENDPALVFVGGWNEWIAYKQLWEGEYMLCDAVDREFSRDIEPMCGGYEDAFYIQLIRNIRRYKGLKAPKSRPVPCGWRPPPCPPSPRSPGVSETIRYTVPAPVNPLRSVEAARVGSSLQRPAFTPGVRASARHPTSCLGTGSVPHGGWQGYAFRRCAGRRNPPPAWRRLKATGRALRSPSFPWKRGRPKSACPAPGGPGRGREPAIYLKAASEVENPRDILSYYTSAACCPPGRLSYSLPLA